MKNPKVVIGFPSGPTIPTRFALDLFSCISYSAHHVPNGVMLANTRGSILPEVRMRVVAQAKRKGATHVLFIDSDQTFPEFIVEKLLSHDKQIVACNIATKSYPAQPTARLYDGTIGGKKLYTTEDTEDLVRVWRVGFGIILIKMTVFEQIKQPYFGIEYREEDQSYLGEDWYFCQKAEKKGIKIYVDQDLSRYIGHLGLWSYNHGDVQGGLSEESGDEATP